MIKKVLNVISRNLKGYSNSKVSSLVIIIGPLILIVVIGALLQNASLKNIEAGVFFSGEGQFKDNFMNRLNERSFITTTESSLEECKEKVIKEINHVCIHLIKSDNDIESYSPYETYDIDIYVDFSKQRIVWSIIGAVQRTVEVESDSIRNALINDIKSSSNNLNSRLADIDEQLYTASLLIDSLKSETTIAKNDLNNVIVSLSASQAILENIQNSGVLSEPYSTQLSQVIQNLDSSNEKLNDVNGTIILSGELNNIGDNIQNARNSVSSFRGELNKLQIINNERLIDPIVLSYYSASDESNKGLINEELGQLDYIFPSFLIFFLLFDSLLLSTTMVIKERKSNSYIRNRISVNNGFIFILGNLLTVFIIVLIQTTVITLVGNLFLGINIFDSIYPLLTVSLVAILIFSLIGIAFGYIFNSYESSITAAASISLLFFLFSSSIIPSETLPSIFSDIIKKSPLTLLETKMRTSLIFNSILKFNLLEVLSLGAVFIMSCLATLIAYKKSKEQEI